MATENDVGVRAREFSLIFKTLTLLTVNELICINRHIYNIFTYKRLRLFGEFSDIRSLASERWDAPWSLPVQQCSTLDVS